MDSSFYNTIWLGLAFLSLFGVTELSYHLFKMHVEITRKVAHVATGLLALLFPILINDLCCVFILCLVFFVLLLLSRKLKYLSSVNAVDRDSLGSIAYPVSVFVCYLVYHAIDKGAIYFNLPILVLAISDPLAALAGKQWPIGKYNISFGEKTMVGSLIFFSSACLISFGMVGDLLTFNSALVLSLIIGVVSTIVEGVSGRGIDNLTIPFSVLLVLYIYINI